MGSLYHRGFLFAIHATTGRVAIQPIYGLEQTKTTCRMQKGKAVPVEVGRARTSHKNPVPGLAQNRAPHNTTANAKRMQADANHQGNT